jgi:hypothetical protein
MTIVPDLDNRARVASTSAAEIDGGKSFGKVAAVVNEQQYVRRIIMATKILNCGIMCRRSRPLFVHFTSCC